MHLLSLPPPPPAATTSISIRTRCSSFLSSVMFDYPFRDFTQFMSRTAHRFRRHARVTWPACHVVLSFRPLRPFSRDAFTTISRSKLTATSSVLGYNSLERQVCQRPSYSVHARSVEGHYRLLSGCNRPRASVHARSCPEASKRISDFVCATGISGISWHRPR